MQIERLVAHAFRNLQRVEIMPQAPTVLLCGPNGQGKTNLLEALYVCATGRSFRHAPNRELIAHQAPHGMCRAILVRNGVRHDIGVHIQSHHRQIKIDGRAIRQSTHLLNLVNVVAFFPDDLRIAKGAPEERRRFFDRAVANSQPVFVQAAIDYARVLKSRNALLRAAKSIDKGMLNVYDGQLVALGSTMHACRRQTLSELLPVAQTHFCTMIDHIELSVHLKSGVSGADDVDAAGFADAFAQSLRLGYPKDRARGMTLSGPHRADLACQLDGQNARAFGSQGQQRSLILALKLAEVVCLTDKLGSAPILLMDDVSSELDQQRCRMLFEVVHKAQGQVWVSTTGVTQLPIAGAVHTVRVRGGTAQ